MTLIEVIMVVVILGLLSMVVGTFLIGWVPTYRINSAARDMVNSFQKCKMEAIKNNRFCSVTFNAVTPGNGTSYDYVVYVDWDENLELDANETVLRAVNFADYKSGVGFNTGEGGGDGLTFTDNDNGRPSIAFDGRGFSISNSLGFGSGSLFLTNDKNETVKVVVSSMGRVRIE